MSHDIAGRVRVGLEELALVREQLGYFMAAPADAALGDMETAAACAVLHSFYTEIEKIFKLIALDYDGTLPETSSWHKDLLGQMAQATGRRPAVISNELAELLGEFLAFRHLFRGASIVLMRWNKLSPLVSKADLAYRQSREQIERFAFHVESQTSSD